MNENKKRIDINDLPKAAATELNAGDLHDTPENTANIKGGVRADKRGTIRKLQGFKGVTGSSGDPGI